MDKRQSMQSQFIITRHLAPHKNKRDTKGKKKKEKQIIIKKKRGGGEKNQDGEK